MNQAICARHAELKSTKGSPRRAASIMLIVLGQRAGDGGCKRERGSKVHIAVETLRQLLAILVMSANEQERAQVADLARQVYDITGHNVGAAIADQGQHA